MANVVTSNTDHGDRREIVITWDTNLGNGQIFAVGGVQTLFDFSRYGYVHLLPIASVGTGTVAYSFTLTAYDAGTEAVVQFPSSNGVSLPATVGTGTPAAAVRVMGYALAPGGSLGIVNGSLGAGVTSVTFKLIGYKSR